MFSIDATEKDIRKKFNTSSLSRGVTRKSYDVALGHVPWTISWKAAWKLNPIGCSSRWGWEWTIFLFITCRAKLLNADWLRQRAFFLNQEGMITWCWLAEHACIKSVSRFKRILKRNFRNVSLLSLILTRSFHLNVKENQHATKRSLLVEKQKDFSDQKRIDSQRENNLSGDGWCWTKH